ncbi:hypothetical protein GMORB2_4920 [Geosmithia morbida]|uniref:Uncharacterized protein n=1 Tax=Geosmithia morbida TaxID=1094350 RepID=A0A9P5D0F6_9HYPO|nr:uncharacterized protein GMORB2_4920 [Geosmithia morbida]KAF4119401.1 hypothetical protein GMORB2_4920 [Geosmithia morbida]
MESVLPLGGFQLPFRQRLSRLYNDTKKSTDFVKGPVQNEQDPEVKALHRKLRIQKDRLVSWGVEWSDPNQSAEIDESLSKAGLSEVVGSIMSTIKDILAEAEPLWLSTKPMPDANRSPTDRKMSPANWDKSHFEDLIRDLTSSIDTLYDLSRTRYMGAVSNCPVKQPEKMSSAVDEPRPFESTRMQTPQTVRPDSLTHLRPKQDASNGHPSREVVFMSKTAYAELTKGTSKEPWAPLLLEYATFNWVYSLTGIMPPMSRFEKLSDCLQQDSQRSPGAWIGLPRLIGYFEDMENSRLGLLYRFPPSFNAVSFESINQKPRYSLPTLANLLANPGAEPNLEAKFRLAHNLANTVFDMHERGFAHGDLTTSVICFSVGANSGPTITSGDVDVRRPLVSSFHLFAEDGTDTNPSNSTDYRSHEDSYSIDERILDLIQLSHILISVGLWQPLESLSEGGSIERHFDQLSRKCGTLYMKAVHTCFSAVENERNGELQTRSLLSAVQMRVSRFLETCCILDVGSGLEDQLSLELRDTATTTAAVSEKAPVTATAASSVVPKELSDVKISPGIPKEPQQTLPSRVKSSEVEADDTLGKPEARTKLYPNIPLPPDVVEQWNTILMPQINQALQQFYRKNPESVEISLESVGPSPLNTRPTIVVVCSSVSKVRAILRKRLGELFDDSTGFALKVCKGHVMRSRRWLKDAVPSMARRSNVGSLQGKDVDIDRFVNAINPGFQKKPGNGASIGAWTGHQHLPPVSFGGLIQIDDALYGMTVHHILDDPDHDFGDRDVSRSSALPVRDFSPVAPISDDDGEGFGYELSDAESEPYSESDISSDWGEEDEEDEEESEPGDIPGIEPGYGDRYDVTQPALDDVEEEFYPSAETKDEDHLDTYAVGKVYASSGIRRKVSGGLTHEVDWALFKFSHDRLPEDNTIPHAQWTPGANLSSPEAKERLLRPSTVAGFSELAGKQVQCTARTSGLQTGQILPALVSVKIYGRTSPSHTYQVTGTASSTGSSRLPIGIPGDSGAWIVDSKNGQLCGHVLAWSHRKQVAYICPMEVLLKDMLQTLKAKEIRLPHGEVLMNLHDETSIGINLKKESLPGLACADNSTADSSYDTEDKTYGSSMMTSNRSMASLTGSEEMSSQSSFRMESPSSGMEALSCTLGDLKLGRRIDVGG